MSETQQTGETSPLEEAGAIPVDEGGFSTKDSDRGFLKSINRDLTAKEAASAAGIRWLQYEADRLGKECKSLRGELEILHRQHDELIARYHDKRVEIEALKGTAKISLRNEFLSALSLVGGTSGLSVFPNYLAIPHMFAFGVTGIVASAVLFLGAIFLQRWK